MEKIDKNRRVEVNFYKGKIKNKEKAFRSSYRFIIVIFILIILLAVNELWNFTGNSNISGLFLNRDSSDTSASAISPVSESAIKHDKDIKPMYAGHSYTSSSPDKILTLDSHSDMFKTLSEAALPGFYGLDVSEWQQHIKWEVLSTGKKYITFSFFIIKATQGTNYEDTHFAYNWKQARKKADILGAYHYYTFGADPYKQAENYIKSVRLSKGDFPPIADIEKNCSDCTFSDLSDIKWVENVRKFLLMLEQFYRVQPIIYSNQAFYDEYLKEPFKEYTFWIAKYSKEPPKNLYIKRADSSDNTSISGNSKVAIWQFTNKEKVPGIASEVDVNFMPNGAKKLIQFYNQQ